MEEDTRNKRTPDPDKEDNPARNRISPDKNHEESRETDPIDDGRDRNDADNPGRDRNDLPDKDQ